MRRSYIRHVWHVGFMLAMLVVLAVPLQAPVAARSACPDDFELTSIKALNQEFPGAGDYAKRKDNNGDRLICVKFQTYPPPAPYSVHIAFVDNK